MAKKSAGKTAAGYVSSHYEVSESPDYVVVELKYETPVAFTASSFAAPAAGEDAAQSLNSVLSKFSIHRLQSHFQLDATTIAHRATPAAALSAAPTVKTLAKKGLGTEFIHSGFVQVRPKSGTDAKKIASALKKHNAVWDAFVAPRPVPAVSAPGVASGSSTGSRNFEPSQGYLHGAPNGIGAMGVWSQPGARGEGVTICDIEGAWNEWHCRLRNRRLVDQLLMSCRFRVARGCCMSL